MDKFPEADWVSRVRNDMVSTPEATDAYVSKLILESINDGVFTTDRHCRIASFNRAAERITGFSRDEAVGNYCFDIFRSDICHSHCALLDTLEKGDSHRHVRATIITRSGKQVPISVTTNVLRDNDGNLIGAVEFFQDLSQVENLRARISELECIDEMASANPEMQRIINLLPDIGSSECNVLIMGPSGAGKELISRALHNLSPRKDGPYIRINCAALPETLLESELFGYMKGAFTDAKRDKEGLFLAASGGTLLLDEIAEMPMSLQVKLLRVLQDGEFQPLGSTKTMKTNARILATTNRDIERMVEEETFREDLYYRINIITVRVPPLKDRPEDLPRLVDFFVQKFRDKRGKAIQGLSAEALKLLRSYDFPGNVRELENAIEHAFVLCHDSIIGAEHLPARIVSGAEKQAGTPPESDLSEEDMIRQTLERKAGNRRKAARELGMHRTTLWRKMKKYGLDHMEEAGE
ncbi:MAG: sigma 54-interacting transcriptional regulator [bacterium]